MTGRLPSPRCGGADLFYGPVARGWFRTTLRAAWLAARRLLARRVTSVGLVAGQPGEQCARLARLAAPGWYMLEVRVASERSLLSGHVELHCTGDESVSERWHFPLHGNRLCKRLLFLGAQGCISLVVRAGAGEAKASTFRLLPVSIGFARSRMLRKLIALHPRYRQDSQGATADLALLWRDYGALFEARGELVPYSDWLAEFGHLAAAEQAGEPRLEEALSTGPVFSVVLIWDGAEARRLAASVDSVYGQAYPNWQLLVVKPEAGVLPAFAEVQGRKPSVFAYAAPAGLASGLDRAIEAADGHWLYFLHAGDLLNRDALSVLAAALGSSPACSLAYTDEDKIEPAGARFDPYCKPDWNIDLLHSQNYVGGSAVYRLELVRAAGAFKKENDGAQLFDLLLRCAERIDGKAVRHVPGIWLHRLADLPADETASGTRANSAGVGALCGYFQRRGIDADVTQKEAGYRVRYRVPLPAPLVTLIVPTRNGLALLRRCLGSIFEKTSYPHYEVIVVDNGSDDALTLRYLEELAEQGRARVLRDDRPFNYSALNNAAVRQARGEIVGLVNNDIEVITPGWLDEMVGHALRPDVGAVGARLWYADETLQHAGIILGMEGTAGHLHRFLPRGEPGYRGRALLTQSFSAVTGACLLVRKHIYELVGGLNETDLPVACNDVDFCLRVGERGYRNVWTPYAELYHHESSSRGPEDSPGKRERAERENAYLRRRWAPLLEADPAFNPNLSLDFTDVVLAWPPRGRPDRVRAAGVSQELP